MDEPCPDCGQIVAAYIILEAGVQEDQALTEDPQNFCRERNAS